MGTESVYVKKEYVEKVKVLARRKCKLESEIRQYALEFGVDTLLELSQK